MASFRSTVRGGTPLSITNDTIEGIKTSNILPELTELLKKCSPNICIAGGAVLDAVAKNGYGKSAFTDIDLWITGDDTVASEKDVRTIISWFGAGAYSIDKAVLHLKIVRRTSDGLYTTAQIINSGKTSLEGILGNFDIPCCQIGLRIVDGEPDLVCTPDFLECMSTGTIQWMYFDQGQLQMNRLNKYYNKNFSFAPHLELLRQYGNTPDSRFLKISETKSEDKSIEKYFDRELPLFLKETMGPNFAYHSEEEFQDVFDSNVYRLPFHPIKPKTWSDDGTYNFGLMGKWNLTSKYLETTFNARVNSFFSKLSQKECERIVALNNCENKHINLPTDKGTKLIVDEKTIFITPFTCWTGRLNNGMIKEINSMQSTHFVRAIGKIVLAQRPEGDWNLTLAASVVCFVPNALTNIDDLETCVEDTPLGVLETLSDEVAEVPSCVVC